MTSPDPSPHTLRAYARGIDTIPYVALLALPFAWAFWAMGAPGNAAPDEIAGSWWFAGYLAFLAYAPSMAVCALGERLTRRWGWPRVRIAIRLVRWAHFAVALGPIILLLAAVVLPPLGRMLT